MTRYYQLSGGGNDFLAIVEPSDRPSPARISAWCRRGLSAGADGLFLLERSPSGAVMTHFNSDGSAAELCLNGTRCAVQLACHLGWANEEIDVLTGAGTIHGRRADSSRIALALPIPEPPQIRELTVGSEVFTAWSLQVGVPHVVLLWPESLESAPVTDLGGKIRSHPDLGIEGANADFVRIVAPNRMEIRTFERGVEAETLACGTGVLAATAVGLDLDRLSLPVSALTLGGFELTVSLSADKDTASWIFTGDARMISEGRLMAGAHDLPDSVRWSD